MSRRPTIALLTDFGVEDTYVGVMKGVILSRCDVDVIDLSHEVRPQNIRQASYLAWTAYRYLPKGTVMVCVVDPGVGTDRDPIAVKHPNGFFVGPDNGWLTDVLKECSKERYDPGGSIPVDWAAVKLTNQDIWLRPLSATFHGRDIFAPSAGALANGMALSDCGVPKLRLVTLADADPEFEDGQVSGRVIHVDHFGNLITNIRGSTLPSKWEVSLPDGTVVSPADNYQVSRGQLIALIGSRGLLELALANGNAQTESGLDIGAKIQVRVSNERAGSE